MDDNLPSLELTTEPVTATTNNLVRKSDGIPSAVSKPLQVVISLHGIETRGEWQKELTEAMGGEFVHVPLDYGTFRIWNFRKPSERRKKVDWFRDEYTRVCKEHGVKRPSIIAHSFGTYIFAMALEKYDELEFENVILCGSIVYRDFPWSSFDRRFRFVLHDFGRRDWCVWIAEYGVEDAGPSGKYGFNDLANGRVHQRARPKFRHSDFFYKLNYANVWLPFLRGEIPPEPQAEHRRKTNWKFRATQIAFWAVGLAIAFWVVYFFLTPPPIQQPVGMVLEEFLVDRKVFSRQGSTFEAFKRRWEAEPFRRVELSGRATKKEAVAGLKVMLTIEPTRGIDELINEINTKLITDGKDLSNSEVSAFRRDAYAICTFENPDDAELLIVPTSVTIQGDLHPPIQSGALLLKNCVLKKQTPTVSTSVGVIH